MELVDLWTPSPFGGANFFQGSLIAYFSIDEDNVSQFPIMDIFYIVMEYKYAKQFEVENTFMNFIDHDEKKVPYGVSWVHELELSFLVALDYPFSINWLSKASYWTNI